jgi:uncharacterized caspase-like protein
MSGRALLIACSEYEDPDIGGLRTPVHDIAGVGAVLADPAIGGFDLQQVVNQPEAEVRRRLGEFLLDARRNDLVLVYFAGHGFKSGTGELFLGAKDTRLRAVMSTGLSAGLVASLIDTSPAERTILVLDCCYSGAITRGLRTRDADVVHVGDVFAGLGEGRVIITASKATEYAFEPGERPVPLRENVLHSVFAEAFIHGLRTGAADLDGDGVISIDELYEYVHQRVVASESAQTPGIFKSVNGKLMVAYRTPSAPPATASPAAGPAAEAAPRTPFDAEVLSWRAAATDGIWTAFPGIGASAIQAFRAAGNGDWPVARDMFERIRDDGTAVRWGRALCDAVDGRWAAAGNGFARIARDREEPPSVVAGAGLLAAVALRAVESPIWYEPLELVLEKAPTCPQALAYRGVHLADPGALRLALLLAPDLIDDFAAVSAPIDEAVADALEEAQRRVAVLVRARAATEALDRWSGADRPPGPDTPKVPGDRVGRLRTAWQTVVAQRRWLVERLTTMNSAAQRLLEEQADAAVLALVAATRRTSAEIVEALRETDLPRPVPALGIPPRNPLLG